MSDAVRIEPNSTPYWQSQECLAKSAQTSSVEQASRDEFAVLGAGLLIGLGAENANVRETLSAIDQYLKSSNPCVVGAGLAIVKATWPNVDFPIGIQVQLTGITIKYQTTQPWLSESAKQLLISH